MGNVSETPTPTGLGESSAVHGDTSNLYGSTPPIFIAVLSWLLSFEERETPQYASRLYCNTPPICTAVRAPFVRQYFYIFKSENGPLRHSGKWPIKEGKRPINANGQFSGAPPCSKTAPLKRPITRSMKILGGVPTTPEKKAFLRVPRVRGWIRRGWVSRFCGRRDFQSRGPQLFILKGLGSSGLKIGAPQKREIQPRRIQPPILGPLTFVIN